MSARLEAELGSVAAVFSSFLECVQKLRDSAVNTQSNGESIYCYNKNTINNIQDELIDACMQLQILQLQMC